jgi:hypothetical protein
MQYDLTDEIERRQIDNEEADDEQSDEYEEEIGEIGEMPQEMRPAGESTSGLEDSDMSDFLT